MDDKTRLALVESHVVRIDESLQDMKYILKTSVVSNHNETIQRLSVIETKQDAFIKYQDECDTDRKDMAEKLNNMSGKATIISTVMAAITSGAVVILSAFYGSAHR